MSFRAVTVLVALASALGFVLSPTGYSTGGAGGAALRSNSRVISMVSSMTELPGISSPMGFFDPAGFSAKLDSKEISRFRECELVRKCVC